MKKIFDFALLFETEDRYIYKKGEVIKVKSRFVSGVTVIIPVDILKMFYLMIMLIVFSILTHQIIYYSGYSFQGFSLAVLFFSIMVVFLYVFYFGKMFRVMIRVSLMIGFISIISLLNFLYN